jgi:hypothetical protein
MTTPLPEEIEPIETRPDPETSDAAPLLPRSAWSDQRAFLRAMFRAKKALDRSEAQAP